MTKLSIILALPALLFLGCSGGMNRSGSGDGGDSFSASTPRGRITTSSSEDGSRKIHRTVVQASARVLEVDPDRRRITFEGAHGERMNFEVRPDFQRLRDIQTGDMVNVHYTQSVVYDLREPTPEERANPRSVSQTYKPADTTDNPGMKGTSQVRAVVTVEAVNRETKMITVRSPEDRLITASLEDPDMVEDFEVGDTVVITYTESLLIDVLPA